MSFSSTSWAIALVVSVVLLPQISGDEVVKMLCKYDHYKKHCARLLAESWESLPKNETYCKGEFDGFICWNHTQSNSLATSPCPPFLPSEDGVAHRFCLGNGSWLQFPFDGSIWSMSDGCISANQSLIIRNSLNSDDSSLQDTLTTIYRVGYPISLVCLVVALFLLAFFKKLHCIRNYIHINLMISFIVRYLVILLKDRVIEEHYDTSKWTVPDSKVLTFDCETFSSSGILIFCRLVIVLIHYALTANYFWLLVEGIHLQFILIFPMKTSKSHRFFPVCMAFGWGLTVSGLLDDVDGDEPSSCFFIQDGQTDHYLYLVPGVLGTIITTWYDKLGAPWIPVGIWAVLKLALQDPGCWDRSDERKLWWIIRAPVIVTIVINFFIFINVTRVIISKLHANNMDRSDYKYALAKSTLALIPLLGIHYIVFVIINTEIIAVKSALMNAQVAFELIFTSIQGTLIALFYCFLNSEVQGEVRKFWVKWQMKRGAQVNTKRKPSTLQNSIHATQMTSLMSVHAEDRV